MVNMSFLRKNVAVITKDTTTVIVGYSEDVLLILLKEGSTFKVIDMVHDSDIESAFNYEIGKVSFAVSDGTLCTKSITTRGKETRIACYLEHVYDEVV